jgi:hypothetical protein
MIVYTVARFLLLLGGTPKKRTMGVRFFYPTSEQSS